MKFGFFVHYVWGGSAYPVTHNSDGSLPAGLDDLANRFDADGFARDLSSIGVQYVIFTAWHANMNCLWPSPAMNRWLTGHATTNRDLLRDMITAVKARGIKVLFYTHPRDGQDLSPGDQAATGWTPFNYTTWNNFINDVYGDLISRYGNDIEGLYIDEGGNNGAYVDYTRLRNTIKTANTNLIMLQNFYGNLYTCDLGDIEVNSFGSTDGNAWPAPAMPSSVVMGSTWWAGVGLGQNTAKYSPENIFRYTVLKAGISGSAGGATWAAGPYPGGGWETGVLATMQAAGACLTRVASAITNTYASTSYVTPAGTVMTNLSWGVATRSVDGRLEYVHVLTPPSGRTLVLPPPMDRKIFSAAQLVANGQSVALAQDNSGVTLTLEGTNYWDSLDTAIQLTVSGVRPCSDSTFLDDFSYGDYRWLPASGNWFTQAGDFCQTNTSAFGYNAAVTLDQWGDAAYEFDLRIRDDAGNPTDWAGCNLRKTNATDDHTASGYLVYCRANGQVSIYKNPGNLASVNTGLAFTNRTHVKVVTDGPNLRVYLTNSPTPLLTATDASYPGPGYFSLTTGGVSARFDHVLITPLYGFETPIVSGAQYAPTGSVWNFSPGSGMAANGSPLTSGNPNAPEGVQVAFVQNNGALTNTISFDAGQYQVIVSAAQRGNVTQAPEEVNVLIDGSVVGSVAPPAGATNYQDYATRWITLAGGAHQVVFAGVSTGGGSNTLLLDNVRFAGSSLPAGPMLTWGGGVGNWGDTNWFPGPVSGPAAATNLSVINSGSVTVTSPLPAIGGVTLNGGSLAVTETVADNPANYNWYAAVPQTTINAGASLSLNSASTLHNLTLAGGELAGTGVDSFHHYGGWYLPEPATVTGGLPSTISAPQVGLGSGVFQIQTGATLRVTGFFVGTNGLTLTGGGKLLLASNQAYSGPTSVSGSTLRLANLAPTPGMARWFDASNLGLPDGAMVTNWPDLSGRNASATVLGGGNSQPTFVAHAGTPTGLGALHFTPGPGNPPAAGSQALGFPGDYTIRSVFSVFKGASFLLTDSTAYDFHRPTDNDPTSPPWFATYASPSVLSGATYVNGVLVNGSTYPLPTNANNGFNLIEVITAGPATASGFNKDRVYHAGDQYQAELLLYDFPLTPTQRFQTENYLLAKWFGAGVPGNFLPPDTVVALSGGATFDLGGVSQALAGVVSTDGSGNQVLLGGASLTVSNLADMTLDGAVYGAGSLTKEGTGAWTLTGLSTFSGAVTVRGGGLVVNGSLASGPVTVRPGGVLTGSGSVSGPVTIQPGAVFSPAGMTISNNLTLSPGSSSVFRVSASGACDCVKGLSNAAYAGTLEVINLSGPLSPTNQFTLFSAPAASGSFTTIAGSPGPGLAYRFDPADGVLWVVSTTATNRPSLRYQSSTNTLSLVWPGDHLGWILQTQTNRLNTGLGTNWIDWLATATTTQAVVQIIPSNPAVFFRLRHP